MRLRRFLPEAFAVVVVICFIVIFLHTNTIDPAAGFEGTDTIAASRIAEMTGIPAEEFTPLVPQWVPPSGEVESALFSMQAAAGGILVGLVFGYWIGNRQKKEQIP